MRAGKFVAAVLIGICAERGGAQQISPECTQLLTQDACQKSLDLFAYLAPQLGTVIAGGSAVLGQSAVHSFIGSGRAFPGASVGFRLNLLGASLPAFEDVGFSLSGATNADPIRVVDRLVAGPTVDAAIGVFRGIPFRATNILGLDVLLSALYLPEVVEQDLSIRTPNGGLKLGWGARLGLFQETIVTPGVTLSYLRRDLPSVDITAGSTEGPNDVALSINDLRKRVESWRLTLSKSFVNSHVAIGGGRDTYDASSFISTRVNAVLGGPFRAEQNVGRTSLFTALTLNIGPLRASGELGAIMGGEIRTFNEFDGRAADATRVFGSLGLRLAL